MVPFNLQLELNARPVAVIVQQLDQLADKEGFMRYQINASSHDPVISVVFVNIEEGTLSPEDIIGFSEDDIFTLEEVRMIAGGIRQYNSDRQLNFDQMAFDF